MNLISNFKSAKSTIVSFLIALFPISFIAGNMIININLFLLILATIFFFRKEILRFEIQLLDKLVISFFILILITGPINDYQIYSNKLFPRDHFVLNYKPFLFLRFLLLYFILRFLIMKNLINFKYFFLISLFCILFVSFDILFQFFNGKDIFGYKIIDTKLSGPFGSELIAGSYLQRFSLFALFLFPIFYNSESMNKLQKYLTPILVIIILIGIILSGNRMPLIMFVFILLLMSFFQKQLRKFILPFLISFILIFFIAFNFSYKVKLNFLRFHTQITKMVSYVINYDEKTEKTSQYFREFSTFYDTWQMNKYIGGGIKNFRFFCHIRPNIEKNAKFICNMHPHNYYLEILTETGVIGFIIMTIIFFMIIYKTFLKRYFGNQSYANDKLMIPFIYLFIAEIFPVKSTGSFFTTGNTTYLFLIMTILIGLSYKYSNNNKN